jgi:hypothetical protein
LFSPELRAATSIAVISSILGVSGDAAARSIGAPRLALDYHA